MIIFNSEHESSQLRIYYVNSTIRVIDEEYEELSLLVDLFTEEINIFRQRILNETKKVDLIQWINICKNIKKSIELITRRISLIKHLITYCTNYELSFDFNLHQKEVESSEQLLTKFERVLTEMESFHYLNNVEDIINIYHKFYDNGFNAQLKLNDYKPIFSKTIDNNLFEVVLVIPELLISKDEYNCISISVFINGELDSPIFDLTQLDEVFSFINNYNV